MNFETLTFTRNYGVPVGRLWRVWTDPADRAAWAAPAPGIEVDFLSADTSEGGTEVSICRAPGQPDIRCEVHWLTLAAPRLAINTETIRTPGPGGGDALSHALVTMQTAAASGGATLTLTVQLASLSPDMAAGYRQGFSAALDIIARRLSRDSHAAASAGPPG